MGEDAAEEDKLFAFPPRRVRILRLTVDWAVMHTGDSNAVSVSQLAALPDSITVTLADGSIKPADVVWLTGAYSPDIPGDCSAALRPIQAISAPDDPSGAAQGHDHSAG